MSRLLTYFVLVVVMFIWGLNVVAIKYLVTYLPPLAMQGFRTLLAGVVTLVLLYFLKDLRSLTRREWLYTATAAILGQAAHHALLAVGLLDTTASNAALILGLIPLTTSLLAILFLGDRFTWLRGLGIILGFLGVMLVVLRNGASVSTISVGDGLVFISVLTQAVSFILIRQVTRTLSARQMTSVMLLIGSLSLLAVSLFYDGGRADWGAFTEGSLLLWGVFVLSAVFATGLGHLIFNVAIGQIGAGQTAIFNNLVPFFTLVGASILLDEVIMWIQIVGFCFVVMGVLFGTGYIDNLLLQRKKSMEPKGI